MVTTVSWAFFPLGCGQQAITSMRVDLALQVLELARRDLGVDGDRLLLLVHRDAGRARRPCPPMQSDQARHESA